MWWLFPTSVMLLIMFGLCIRPEKEEEENGDV
jgi:hypothetical protein